MQDEANNLEMTEEELFEGWDDDGTPTVVEQTDDGDAEETDEAEESETEEENSDESDNGGDDEEAEEETEEDDGETAEDEAPEDKHEETDQFFELKYMGESKKVNSEEIIALAQKGLDYDRIREDRDTLKNQQAQYADFEVYKDFLEEIAKGSNIDIPTLIDQTRAQMIKAQKEKAGEEISDADAMKQAKAAREAKAKAKAAPEESEEEKKVKEEQAQQSRRQASFKRFLTDFPEVKAENIPKEVWADYTAGKGDLSDLYARYENKRLKEELETERKNKKNKERSTGSRKSTGKSADSKWFEGWED